MQNEKWQHTFSALLIGAGVGAVLGVLFAPRSGEDTRDSILGGMNHGYKVARNKGKKLAHRAKDAAAEAMDQAAEAAESVERAFTKAKGA